MTCRLMSCTVVALTIAIATAHAADAAAQTPTDRRTAIGASLYFEVPVFGRLGTAYEQGGPTGLSPGVSIRLDRAVTSRVGVGLEIDLSAAHIWRGTTVAGENVLVDLPAVEANRFNTFSPVLRYQIGSAGRWAFVVNGGLAFAHIRSGYASATLAAPTQEPEPTMTAAAYTVGLTTGFSAELRTTRRLRFVADVRATSVSVSNSSRISGFVIRPGAGMRFAF